MTSLPYLLDANVFIQAKNGHYGFDFCPAFWDWLIEQNQAGNVASVDKVRNELFAKNDPLKDWAVMRGGNFFLKPDASVISNLTNVSACVEGKEYYPGAVSKFLDSADYWLIAHALAHERIVVTHEVKSNSKKEVKIPDVCAILNLQCMNTFEMLRREQARFVLETGTS